MTRLLEVNGLEVDIVLDHGVLRAVRGVSFGVERGETLCIVGESGCGKSLTGLALTGLLPRTAIRRAQAMRFQGMDLFSASPREMRQIRGNRIAMIFQEPMTSLNPTYTIGNQLVESLRYHQKVSVAAARDRAVHLLEKVGIRSAADRMSSYPHELSGGLRQRVMIAMALMCDPDLIVADEPTTALDVTTQAQILTLLADLQREFGMALMIITHDLSVVARMATTVAVMYAGKIIERGDMTNIFEHAQHPYTRGLLSCVPRHGARARGQQLPSIPGIVPTLVGDVSGCAFRDRCPDRAGSPCEGDIPVRQRLPGHEFTCVHSPKSHFAGASA